jgi:hypothetical protein
MRRSGVRSSSTPPEFLSSSASSSSSRSGFRPGLGKQQYDEIYADIARAITAAVAARPEAKKLLTQRTFVRALH